MVSEIHQYESDKPMTLNILSEILRHSGGSIAAFGGSLAVVLTFAANLAQWVAICGGALGLVAGILGIVSKVQEIKFKNLQYREFVKQIERDDQQLEEARKAGERAALKKEVLNELKQEQ